MYDIAIIGLGPAGATIARLLNKKYNVVVIEAKKDSDFKCCGGLLSPDSQKILAKFNLCLPTNILVDPQIFSVKTIDLDNNIEKYYQRFYLNMNRSKFDNWLISLIPNNIDIIKNAFCKKITKENSYYKIEYQNDKEIKTLTSKVVIGADGANSIVRKTFFTNEESKKYISIQEWYKNDKLFSNYTAIFDNTITNSYCWMISKDTYILLGGAFPKKDAVEKFNKLKSKLIDKGYNFSTLLKKEGCYVTLSNGIKNIKLGKDNIYLIGEAAGMISSSSLEGISYAMESAYILSKILNKQLLNNQNKYWIKTFKIRLKLMLKRLKRPFMYNKFLRMLVMKSGLKTIKVNK